MRFILALALFGSVALADPPKPKAAPPSADAQKRYADQMRAGRKLQGAHDYLGAERSFTAALVAIPDDPTALGELGWSQYLAKDYKVAEVSTRKALAGEGTPAIRGAALYNLGLIEEQAANKTAAVAAYRDSIVARPNGVVRAALAKLDPAAAKALDPWKPVALAGPFPTADGFCKTLPTTLPDDDFECGCGIDDTTAVKRTLAPPFTQVESVTHGCSQHATENGLSEQTIAVKTAKGWYGGLLSSFRLNRWCNFASALADVVAKDVAGAPGAELLVHYATETECSGANGATRWKDTSLFVIGGATPAVTPAITVRSQQWDTDEGYAIGDAINKLKVDVALELAWGAAGEVTVTGKTKGLDANEASNQLGKHSLVFP